MSYQRTDHRAELERILDRSIRQVNILAKQGCASTCVPASLVIVSQTNCCMSCAARAILTELRETYGSACSAAEALS